MGTRGSPDIYTLSPWACGPRASGAYIRQTTRAHSITITYITAPRVYLKYIPVVSFELRCQSGIIKYGST